MTRNVFVIAMRERMSCHSGPAHWPGSTIVLDRQAIARQLGFSRVSQNSLDAVGDRDFVCEFLFCLAMVGMHLSRLSEDLITWNSSEFGFVEFSDAFSTGSELDAAERRIPIWRS